MERKRERAKKEAKHKQLELIMMVSLYYKSQSIKDTHHKKHTESYSPKETPKELLEQQPKPIVL